MLLDQVKKLTKKRIFKVINKWHTSECKNECDPKGHMKVVGSEEIKELKEEINQIFKLNK